MESAGLWMLGSVGVLILATGLPAFVVLIAVSAGFAAWGVITGILPAGLLTALPYRLIGLLESDLLQALPLYVLMGAALNRMPLAERLFDAIRAPFGRSRAGPPLAGLLLGALLGPMNGSVGAAVVTLMQSVLPRLRAAGMGAADSLALVTTASTFGVIVPPSLVLILFGDTMMRAHTEALNATKRMDRIINTADIFHGALLPAALLLLATSAAIAWRMRGRAGEAPLRPNAQAIATAVITFLFIAGLLALVAAGYLYAVEAAACGAVSLFGYGIITRTLDRTRLDAVLRETMAVTGGLFALFVGATTFSLVLRAFGTDQLLGRLIAGLPPGIAVAAVLLMLGLSALVLDTFEIIIVLVPVLMPPLLMRSEDAVWVSVAALMVLQTSFLLPPIGYAILLARGRDRDAVPLTALSRSLAPYLLAQAAVLALVLAFPGLTHAISGRPVLPPQRPAAEAGGMLNSMLPAPDE